MVALVPCIYLGALRLSASPAEGRSVQAAAQLRANFNTLEFSPAASKRALPLDDHGSEEIPVCVYEEMSVGKSAGLEAAADGAPQRNAQVKPVHFQRSQSKEAAFENGASGDGASEDETLEEDVADVEGDAAEEYGTEEENDTEDENGTEEENEGNEAEMEQDAASDNQTVVRAVIKGESPHSDEELLASLEKRTDVALSDAPLPDALAVIAKKHGIQVFLDRNALDNAGIESDAPVALNLKGIKLKNALKLLLRPLELNYTLKHGLLIVTTPEEEELSYQIIRTYDVFDLVASTDQRGAPNFGGDSSYIYKRSNHFLPGSEIHYGFNLDMDSLMHALVTNVLPDSWSDVGGQSDLRAIGESLVVRQTLSGHEQVVALLANLRRARKAQQSLALWFRNPSAGSAEAALSKFNPQPIIAPDDESSPIEAALDKTIDLTLPPDCPLTDAMSILGEMLSIPMLVDSAALDAAGIAPDDPVNCDAKKITARTALEVILGPLELTCTPYAEVLLVTTPEAEETDYQKVVVCPVLDLVALPYMHSQWRRALEEQMAASDEDEDEEEAPHEGVSQAFAMAAEASDYDTLRDLILTTVEPDSWDEAGGRGSCRALPLAGALVIAQTHSVHQKIAALLADIRRKKQVGKLPNFTEEWTNQVDASLSVVTRVYPLVRNIPLPAGTFVNGQKVYNNAQTTNSPQLPATSNNHLIKLDPSDVEEQIRNFVQPQYWMEGMDDAMLQAVEGRLTVRASIRMQWEVEDFLNALFEAESAAVPGAAAAKVPFLICPTGGVGFGGRSPAGGEGAGRGGAF